MEADAEIGVPGAQTVLQRPLLARIICWKNI